MDLHDRLLAVAVGLARTLRRADAARALGQWPIDAFPPGFFDRSDPAPDDRFYSWPRLVTHIDDGAIAAVGALYEELGIDRRGARPHGLVGVALPRRARPGSPCSA